MSIFFGVRAVSTWLSKGIGFGFGFGFTTPFGWLVHLLWFWFYDSQAKTALNSKGLYQSWGKEKEKKVVVFYSRPRVNTCNKALSRCTRVQWGLRNVQKKRQSCCFANINLLFFFLLFSLPLPSSLFKLPILLLACLAGVWKGREREFGLSWLFTTPFLTKLFRSRCQGVGLVLFCVFIVLDCIRLGP